MHQRNEMEMQILPSIDKPIKKVKPNYYKIKRKLNYSHMYDDNDTGNIQTSAQENSVNMSQIIADRLSKTTADPRLIVKKTGTAP